MSYPIDTSRDFEVVVDAGLEDVLFYCKLDEGVFTQSIPAKGKMMPLSKKEIEMGNADLITFGVVWHVWKYHLRGREPKYGDKIVQVSTGSVFIINPLVDIVSLSNRFRCVTMRVPGLTDKGL